MFASLVGQASVWERLVAAYQNDRVASAYLFHGACGRGKEGFAVKFAALLNCQNPGREPCASCSSCVKFRNLQHPNLTLVIPLPRDRPITKDDPPVKALSDRTLAALGDLMAKKSQNLYAKIDLPRAKTILLNTIREIRQQVYLKAIEPGRKVILVFDAQKLMTSQGESANALLKILEEPPDNTSFILTTDYPDRLFETIRSRCQRVFFPPLPEHEIEEYVMNCHDKEEHEARLIAHLSQGNVRMAQSLAAEDVNQVEELLRSMVEWISQASETGWRRFLQHGSSVYRVSPQEFFFHMQLLSYWFRDAMHLQKIGGDAQLILGNMRSEIGDFASRFPNADFSEIITVVESCTDSLSRNYNLNLVLTNSLLDIHENLKGGFR